MSVHVYNNISVSAYGFESILLSLNIHFNRLTSVLQRSLALSSLPHHHTFVLIVLAVKQHRTNTTAGLK